VTGARAAALRAPRRCRRPARHGAGTPGARPIRHGVVQDVDATLALLREHRPTWRSAFRHRCSPSPTDPGLRLKAVLLSTDHVPLSLTRAVEQAWHCRVFNHYGMTETGLGGGVECEARRGYHLREADLYVEIVEPDGALPVPDGEPGEVVVTTLTRTGMPLIRYRTGDLSGSSRDRAPAAARCAPWNGSPAGPRASSGRRPAPGSPWPSSTRCCSGSPASSTSTPACGAAPPATPWSSTCGWRAGPGAPQLAPDTVAAAVNVIPALDPGSPSGAVGVRIIVRPATAVAAPAKRRMKVVERDA